MSDTQDATNPPATEPHPSDPHAGCVPTAAVRAIADELDARLNDELRDRQVACEWAMYELYRLVAFRPYGDPQD